LTTFSGLRGIVSNQFYIYMEKNTINPSKV
jgi:hypothetical protein